MAEELADIAVTGLVSERDAAPLFAESRGMSATLGTACVCGRSIVAPCPTLADLSSAMSAITDSGWRWFDDIGIACSAACALAMASGLALLQRRASVWPPDDLRLFAEMAGGSIAP